MQILLYLGIGLTVGSVSGALGIGGGVLLLPALIWLCGFEPRMAAGTTLAVLVVPVVLPAAWKYYSARLMDPEAAVWIASAFVVGGYFGAYLAVNHYLPDFALRLGFGLMMIFVAVRLMLSADSEAANAAAGLLAAGAAWLLYLGLRFLGRRHLAPPPDLGDEIRLMQKQGHGEAEYYI
jgi:uncharacterized membrane protein YfcA